MCDTAGGPCALGTRGVSFDAAHLRGRQLAQREVRYLMNEEELSLEEIRSEVASWLAGHGVSLP